VLTAVALGPPIFTGPTGGPPGQNHFRANPFFFFSRVFFGVPSDVFSRYQRMAGNRVLIGVRHRRARHADPGAADAEGLTARQLADKYNRVIVEDLQGLGLGYDLFHPHHHQQPLPGGAGPVPGAVRNGYVVAKTTMARSARPPGAPCRTGYVEGTCPICGYDSARGDQV